MNNFIKYPTNTLELQRLSGVYIGANEIYLFGILRPEPNIDTLIKGITTKVFLVQYLDVGSDESTAIFDIGKEALKYDFTINLDSTDIPKPTLVKFNIIDQEDEEPTVVEVTPETYTDQDPQWYITHLNGVFAVSVPTEE